MAVALCALAATAGSASAAEPVEVPARITLADAVTIFRQRSFELLIANIGVDGARADERAAGAVANPNVALAAGKTFHYDARCAGCSNVAWSATVSDQGAISNILSGKRGLRVDAARAGLEGAKLARDDAARTLEFAVKQQYLEASVAQASVEFAREAAASIGETLDLVTVRYRAGAVSEADLAKIETAKLEADQMVDSALQALRVAKVGLSLLLGMRAPSPEFELEADILHRRPPLGLALISREELKRSAFDHRPDLKAAAWQKQRAEISIAVNKRQRFPDIGLMANYVQEGTGQLAIQPPTLMLGVSLPLPIVYQFQGEVAKAQAELRARAVIVAKTQALVSADVETAHAVFVAAGNRIERMEARLLERAARARELADVQYQKGSASLLELLDAQRVFLATNVEYLQDLGDYWGAIFALEQAVGTELVK